MLLKNKHIIIILLSVFAFSSCRSKKFNGTSEMPCANYQESKKDKSWIGIKKKGKSRLFKKKGF